MGGLTGLECAPWGLEGRRNRGACPLSVMAAARNYLRSDLSSNLSAPVLQVQKWSWRFLTILRTRIVLARNPY
jgi:hypothetical protein